MSAGEHFRIAGLSVSVYDQCLASGGATTLNPAYDPFRVDPDPTPDVVVHASCGEIKLPPADEQGPTCTALFWNSYTSRGRLVVALSHSGGPAWRMAIRDGSRWDVTTSSATPREQTNEGLLPHAFVFPLGDLVCLDALSQRGRLLCHCCGIVDDVAGAVLFCGRSGRGKSTIGRLWAQTGATVLNDDRVAVQFHDDTPVAHGTPWHGDFTQLTATCAPIRAVFYLEHASHTQSEPIDSQQSIRNLLDATWHPLWAGAPGVRSLWSQLAQIVPRVPAYRLRFRPDMSAIREVRRVVLSQKDPA